MFKYTFDEIYLSQYFLLTSVTRYLYLTLCIYADQGSCQVELTLYYEHH